VQTWNLSPFLLNSVEFQAYVFVLQQPPSGKGVLTEDPTVAGLISRTDVANLVSMAVGMFSILVSPM
jgi:hypothetical protein